MPARYLRRLHALDPLNLLPLDETHNPANTRNHTRQANEKSRRPRRPIEPTHAPHEAAEAYLEQSVPYVTPHEEVDLPEGGWGCADAREGLRRCFFEFPRVAGI